MFMPFVLRAAGVCIVLFHAPTIAAFPVVIAIGGTCLFDQEGRDQRCGVSRVDAFAQDFPALAVDWV